MSSLDTDLSGATVTISAGTLEPGDMLNFTNQNGISGAYAGGMLTLSGSATPAQYQAALQSVTFSSISTSTTTRSLSIVVDDSSASPTTSNSASEQVDVDAPVTIVGAYVAGSAWTDSGSNDFDEYLASSGLGSTTDPALGYALQTGANQLTTLPWANIDTISVQFSGPVNNIGLGSLALAGGTGPEAVAAPAIAGFTSDGNNTYSWTLASPLGDNRYVFAIATTGSSFGAPGSTQVTDANGAGISGTFATGQALPSGNGLAGSTFDFFFNVLPGDVDQSGAINSTDLNDVRGLASGTRSNCTSYNPYYDLLGSGVINATTLSTIRSLTGRLASGSPLAPSDSQEIGTTGFTALALGRRRLLARRRAVRRQATRAMSSRPA